MRAKPPLVKICTGLKLLKRLPIQRRKKLHYTGFYYRGPNSASRAHYINKGGEFCLSFDVGFHTLYSSTLMLSFDVGFHTLYSSTLMLSSPESLPCPSFFECSVSVFAISVSLL